MSTMPRLPLVPGPIASKLARHGASGYPDIVAWESPRQPRFVELKGLGDRGTAQAQWLAKALQAGTIGRDHLDVRQWQSGPDNVAEPRRRTEPRPAVGA
ncbi:MAG: VRR-NUC domain-containing protein [Candidatus Limnocylindrales bacterium]